MLRLILFKSAVLWMLYIDKLFTELPLYSKRNDERIQVEKVVMTLIKKLQIEYNNKTLSVL